MNHICKIFNLKKKWLGCITLESIFDASGAVSILVCLLRKILSGVCSVLRNIGCFEAIFPS